MPSNEIIADVGDFNPYFSQGAGGSPNAFVTKGNEGAEGASGDEGFIDLYRSTEPNIFESKSWDVGRAPRNIFGFFLFAGCSPTAPGAGPARAPAETPPTTLRSKLGKIRPSELPAGSLIVNDPDKMLLVIPSRDFSLGEILFPARSKIYLDHLDRIRVVNFSRPTMVQGFPVADGYRTLFYPTGEIGGLVLAVDQKIGDKIYPAGTALILNPKGEVTQFQKP